MIMEGALPRIERHSAFLGDDDFIAHAYSVLLKRPVDAGAVIHYAAELADGMLRSQLVEDLRRSSEFLTVDRGQLPPSSIASLVLRDRVGIWAPLITARTSSAADIEDIWEAAVPLVDATDTFLSADEVKGLFGPTLGWIDPIRNGKIAGWLVYPRVEEVSIFIEGAPAGTVQCNRFRPDLEAAGLVDPCCGFYYEIEPGRIQSVVATIQVFADGVPLLPIDRISSDWLIARRDGLRAIADFEPFQSRTFKGQ